VTAAALLSHDEAFDLVMAGSPELLDVAEIVTRLRVTA
jgi:hypothetical protein